MNTKKIPVIKTNEKIARWMGAYSGNPSDGKRVLCGVPDFWSNKSTSTHFVSGLQYHKRWDWIMPVVQKILNSDMDGFDSYVLWVSDSLKTADIKQVYDAVIDYLESRKK